MSTLKIPSPRIRLSFGSDGIPISTLPTIVKLTADALHSLGLADRSAACTITNEGHTIRLLDPQGVVVWSRLLDGGQADDR